MTNRPDAGPQTQRETPPAPPLRPLSALPLAALDDLDLPVGAVCDPDDPDCAAPEGEPPDETPA